MLSNNLKNYFDFFADFFATAVVLQADFFVATVVLQAEDFLLVKDLLAKEDIKDFFEDKVVFFVFAKLFNWLIAAYQS